MVGVPHVLTAAAFTSDHAAPEVGRAAISLALIQMPGVGDRDPLPPPPPPEPDEVGWQAVAEMRRADAQAATVRSRFTGMLLSGGKRRSVASVSARFRPILTHSQEAGDAASPASPRHRTT